ncbi:TetR/AcrR family transcriptional regulator [Silanimonas sp.]|uniref:TetR/AcrR family transcriptional regulator n=1 Tax=Silanimonas sp. TaxID=1929290 RepID=UPI001BC5F230|nr:TetR/AcrR family transcriptional regulator [Silanimonas sp.]MBS3895895.1 TetR/AcrR family transcriptional regulator [Silanimonas sp.]MBS3924601.1 TetR/AcrR family transcriptional regulator [Xanthomonadaceae bacterium]
MTNTARTAASGRPKDPEKRAALVEAAGTLFCQHGFEAVSLEAIAQAAGVSKLTIYSHFGDKEGLFTAAVAARCQQQLPQGLFERSDGLPLRDALRAIGQAFTALVFSEDALQLNRTMAAQAQGDGRLAALYFAAGPKRLLEEMEGFLRGQQASGQLALGDPREAAAHFFVLLKGLEHLRCLIGLCPPPSPAQLAAHVERCVTLFLRAHGAPCPPSR